MIKIIDMDDKDWDLNFDVNSKGVFHVSKYVARNMIENGTKGKIVSIASMAGKLAALDPIREATFEGLVRMDLDTGQTELPLCRLIDLANSEDCCHVAPDVGNDEQLGRFYVNNDFPVLPPGLPEEVYEVLDYAAIGRKARIEEGGVFTSGGYVVQHSDLDVSYSQARCGPQMEVRL